MQSVLVEISTVQPAGDRAGDTRKFVRKRYDLAERVGGPLRMVRVEPGSLSGQLKDGKEPSHFVVDFFVNPYERLAPWIQCTQPRLPTLGIPVNIT